jgi:phosphate:Na+ symporter
MRAGQTTEASAVHLDLLRSIRRVNTHLVAAAAYPVLEREGALLPSRLTSSDPTL